MLKDIFLRLFYRSGAESQKKSLLAEYYKILGVRPDASLDVINKAYADQSKKLAEDLEMFSYDTRLKQRAEEMIGELEEAYQYVTGNVGQDR